jgi:predicted O-methyltransferase YrrM
MTTDRKPAELNAILADTRALGFGLSSDELTGRLLRTLAASKPGGHVLEIGTGTGHGTAWLLDGMDAAATLDSVDSSAQHSAVARRHLGHDPRVTFHVQEGAALLQDFADQGRRFDLIFADTYPGKFTHRDVALGLLAHGGLYVVDDLLPGPTWPAGHAPQVQAFLADLEARPILRLTRLDWSTGLLIAALAE